ncbi:MAG: hypothetical protein FWC78_06375 [Defluviitaleaceae bacterium]|nr:hypothetical protein [Defluviitaleaceae bacterium]
MALEKNHLRSRVQVTTAIQPAPLVTLHRIRQGIDAAAVERIIRGVAFLSSMPPSSANLTITSELHSAS